MPPRPIELPPEGLADRGIVVRPYRREDAAPILAGTGDPLVVRYAHVSWAGQSVKEVEDLIVSEWPDAATDGRQANLSIRDAATDALLGHLVLFRIDWRADSAEVGFFVLPEARGRGAAGHALAAFLPWALDELGLRRIQAAADVENRASQHILEGAGFVREGVMRSFFPREDDGVRADYVLYSLLPGELVV